MIFEAIFLIAIAISAFLFVRWRRRELNAMEEDRQEIENLRRVMQESKRD